MKKYDLVENGRAPEDMLLELPAPQIRRYIGQLLIEFDVSALLRKAWCAIQPGVRIRCRIVSREQRLHFRRAVEPQESAERSRVFLLEMLGPLDAQQRHEQKRQQRRAQTIEGGTHVTVELAADRKQPALDQTGQSQ